MTLSTSILGGILHRSTYFLHRLLLKVIAHIQRGDSMTEEEKQPEEKKQPKERKKRKRGGRRAHGTGSVFQLLDRKGKQWVAQILLENGKTRQRYFWIQAEAADALNEMFYEQKRGMLATSSKQTLKQFLEYWVEVHKSKIRESASNFEAYTFATTVTRGFGCTIEGIKRDEKEVQTGGCL
jgi:hypothetical protein